jgi:hypothetical protein
MGGAAPGGLGLAPAVCELLYHVVWERKKETEKRKKKEEKEGEKEREGKNVECFLGEK